MGSTVRDMRVINSIQDFDRRWLLLLQHSRSWLALHARAVSKTGDGSLYVVVSGLIYLLSATGETFLIHILAAFSFERIAYWVVKNGLKRKRPAEVLPNFQSHITASDEFSFPSGHTSATFLFATVLGLHFGPIMLPLYLWSMAVGISRVYLGVHFPTDTVMGAILGMSIALSTAYGMY
ncbi:MAG: phosphatase PAP2 family protein [Pseudomonadota bacterium]